jgi:hypothetical protein
MDVHGINTMFSAYIFCDFKMAAKSKMATIFHQSCTKKVGEGGVSFFPRNPEKCMILTKLYVLRVVDHT